MLGIQIPLRPRQPAPAPRCSLCHLDGGERVVITDIGPRHLHPQCRARLEALGYWIKAEVRLS